MSCEASELDFTFAVFDCDGVILDSNPIKTEAFRQALDHYPARKVEELVDYHVRHGGVSRYEKFRYFFDSLPGPSDDDEIQKALKKFSAYCQAQLLEVPLVPGVRSYLEQLNASGISVYVVSGSDQIELIEVLGRRKLLPLFKLVLGSPTPKRENLKTVLDNRNLRDRGISFGDAKLDYQIASEHGLDFVFVFGYSEWENGIEFCRRQHILCIPDFQSLCRSGDS